MDIRTLILKNLKKCKKLFILFCITFILTCTILPLETWLISRLVGCFEIKNTTEALNQCFTVLLILVGYYLIRALINGYYATYIKEAFSQTFLSHLVTDIFTKIHAHSVRYFDDEMSGRVSSALTGLCQSLTQLFTDTCFLLIRPIGILIISYSSVVLYPFPPLPVNSKKVKLSVINTKALPDKQFFFFHFDMFTVQKTNCTSSM